jgi:hypothetical protein
LCRGDVLVYPISAVSIPDELREQFGVVYLDTRSKRTNVILLAMALQRTVPSAAEHVTCIADADAQHIRPFSFGTSFLVFTDYTSIEMYGFRADLITKLIRIGSPKLKLTGEGVITQLTGILEALFSIRIANHQIQWELKWICPHKECTYKDGTLAFNEPMYLDKYLNTKGKLGRKTEFLAALNELRNSFSADHRLHIRGHDFVELLAWYLKKRSSSSAFRELSGDSVRHNLLSQLRVDDLAPEPLFSSLLTKYQRTTPA